MTSVSDTKPVASRIDALLLEANDCELIGSLATDPETRRLNRERAASLRKLAGEAKQVIEATPHEG